MKKIPVALQLYSLRDECKADFAATVKAVSAMGYGAVETAGYGNLEAKDAHAALRDAGLAVSSMHVGLDKLRDHLNAVIDEALLMETKHVVCPWWSPGQFVSGAACQKIGEELNALGSTLRAFGLQLSYHNHASELKVVDGRTVFDWMLSASEPRNLAAEVDVYWVHLGGISPRRFLLDHGARCKLVHLKDEKELGLGPVDFADVFATVDAIGGTDWLIVEQEQYNHAPLESVRLCLEQLRSWGRV